MKTSTWILISAAVIIVSAVIVQTRIKDIEMETKMPEGMPLGKLITDLSSPMNGDGEHSGLPVLSEGMPEFDGIAEWLNSAPLKQEELRGKVVLIDFWTYSCINCIRTLPYVTSWHEKYKSKGFTVIGVHTPEFAFEKVPDNVREAIERHKITYPVPLDNDYATWNNYSNRYWPAEYLFDAKGRLRYTHFGEGEYDRTERNIQALIEEAGREADETLTEGAVPNFSKIGSPETYLGYKRMELLASPEEPARDRVQSYTASEDPQLNRFYLSGRWKIEEERSIAEEDGAAILYRYYASNANLVMEAEGKKRVEVRLDGAPVPDGARGADIIAAPDGRTYVEIDEARLYDLIRTPGRYGEHLLELRFDAGAAGYAFTFG